MKSELLQDARRAQDVVGRTNIARQYVQRQILATLSGSSAFASLAFVGGTCLRFLHDLKRYSEDLDFSVEERDGYTPDRWIEAIRIALAQQGLPAEVSWRDRRAVDIGWVKLPGLLHELDIAPTRSQRLAIKIEVDKNPPAGARCVTSALTVPRLIAVRHYDLRSLMAGKINAVLSRPYAKGRDWYDLLWYLARRIEPNVTMLSNGLKQTPSVHCADAEQWRGGVLNRLGTIDWVAVVADVRPFLEVPSELDAFTLDTVRAMLSQA
jgi:hypothetical protein